MSNLLVSLWEKEIWNGYSLSSFDWWVDLFIILGAVLVLGTLYFLLVWLFGRMRLTPEEKAQLKEYKRLPKSEKKAQAKAAKGPLKRVIVWKKIRPWLIPTTSVVLVIALVATPVLYSLWDTLMTTLSGSKVQIIDTLASKEAAAEAEKNVVTIEEEGLVLLKNDNNTLPLKNKKVNIFGACAYGLFYGNGGSGSFQTDGRVKSFPRTALKLEKAMQDEGFEINENLFNMIKNYYKSKKVSVTPVKYDIQCGFNKYGYSEIVASKAPYDYEPPVSAYEKTFSELGGKSLLQNAKSFSDTAIFCITRRGSEDEDMTIGDLQLKKNEKACIEMLEANFKKVIILLNVPTVMEAKFLEDEKISAAIYMGHPGLTGTKAVAEALYGRVNPSGHLVDTWPYDVKSAPSYQCFGNDTTLQHTGASTGYFTNYQEGIYVGYRYYVTRAKEDNNYKYEDNVQYSFGYGLSYTKFEKEIVEFNVDKEAQTVEIKVDVKNAGNYDGKDVIQIYNHAPYYKGGIEKSYYDLIAFTKTDFIPKGETKQYTLSFTFRDMASWDTSKGYYVSEHGDYEVSLRDDVWNLSGKDDIARTANTRTFNLESDIEYKTSYQTGKAYENIFQDVEWGAGNEKIQYLSRNDFAGTWKNKSDISRVAVADKFPGGTSNTTGGNTIKYTDNQIAEPAPLTGQKNGLKLADLKNAEWDDERWPSLLDQLTTSDLKNLVDEGSFKTTAVSNISKSATTDYDGPSAAFHSGTGHPSEVVVACSWSVDVAKIMGESIGREGAARGLTGWYAPGINTHRSPFGGRNFEYYSEDPLIAGHMAGNTAVGMMKYGVYTYAKHFICNDQEAHRTGVFVWASEQAIRQIYARGFEIYVDYGGIGIMSSFNCLGSWWAGASKPLLTTLLREEWGFHGVVVTDYVSSPYMGVNIGVRAGNDLWLNKSTGCDASYTLSQTPNDGLILLRRAAKNILYACAHSNNVWTKEDYAAVGITEIKKTNSQSCPLFYSFCPKLTNY